MKARIITLLAVVLWASAFVGIRAGLQGYTPGGLALLRYLIASVCMLFIVLGLPKRPHINLRHKAGLLLLGALGVGLYNITLNIGEISVTSGIASFIVSLSPLITAVFALLFLREKVSFAMIAGMLVSIFGVALIMLGETTHLSMQSGIYYLLIAMLISAIYSVAQKPFLQKYHTIEVTAYVIWGATLLLTFYTPEMISHYKTASLHATLAVIYLGIFPAALGYVGWSYGLKKMPVSQAVNYLYFMPIVATLLGWIWLGEVPTRLSLLGGLVALFGVWVVSQAKKALLSRELAQGIAK